MKHLYLTLITVLLFVNCTSQEVRSIREIETRILKAADLEHLTPDSVLVCLRQGNRNFVERNTKIRDSQTQLAKSASIGQAPMAVVLSCIDSRVPVETIFDMGIGDLFVARVAGNVVCTDMLASMEYACKYIGSKIVLVLGHEFCGAVNAACAGLKDGNLTDLLHKIQPAVELARMDGNDPFSKEFQSQAVGYNVGVMVNNIRNSSEILAELERQGKIQIVGGVFNLDTGLVTFTEPLQ